MSLPKPNLDDKRFEELVKDAKKLIPIYAPEWTDYNVHDPGITLIELFAWLTEMQIYRLNRITEKNKLKFLKLLGEKPKPATPAKAQVKFTLQNCDTPITVKKDTKIAAQSNKINETIIFETDHEILVTPINIKRIITRSLQEFRYNTNANDLDGHYFYAFGKDANKGNSMYLGFDKSFPRKKINLNVSLYEKDLTPPAKHGNERPDVKSSIKIKWEYFKKEKNTLKWVDLHVHDKTLNFSFNETICFKTPEDMIKSSLTFLDDEQEFYWIRCKIIKDGYEIPPRIGALRLNMVSATQGVTINEEIIGSSDGTAHQKFSLKFKPVIYGTQIISIEENGTWVNWEEVTEFDTSGPDDNHYVTDHDTGTISFGNGVNGLIPPKGKANIKARYRYGGGSKGNLNKDEINQILDPHLKMLTVVNEQATQGGSRKELIKEAKIRVRKDIKEPYQAVNSQDYEYIAIATPGMRVKRAKATVNLQKNLVKIIVVPESILDKPVPSEGFINTVYNHLNRHRLITTQIEVVKPVYVGISVEAVLKVKSGYRPDDVVLRAEKTLKKFINPLKGGFNGKGWPFGRSVFKSEIYEILGKIEGVDCVHKVFLTSDENNGESIKIPEDALVYSKKHYIQVIS